MSSRAKPKIQRGINATVELSAHNGPLGRLSIIASLILQFGI
jgi:hypothetical protein